MKPGTRTLVSTAVLLGVAAAAVAGAWFGIARPDRAARSRQDAEARLYGFAPAKVTAISVEAKGETTRLVRAGDRWRIEAPVQADAERATVDALVDRIAGLRRKASIAPAADEAARGRYGLARPRAKVSLTLEGGKTETLALGDDNPFDGSAFVGTTGGSVALVPGDVRWAVERSTFDLREKRLLPFEEAALRRVEVTAPGGSYALTREPQAGGGEWRLEAPVKDRADDAAVERVLGTIRGLRATGFVAAPGGDGPYGLDRPRWTVRLLTGDAARTLAIGEAAAAGGAPRTGGAPRSLYARVEGSREVATIADGAAKELEQDLGALRDRTLLRFDRDQAAVIRLARGGGAPFEVRREGASARFAGHLWTLSSLRGRALVGEGEAAQRARGLDHPALEVAILAADGKELARLLVSPERAGKTYARSASSPRVLEIDPAPLASLPRSARDDADGPSPAEVKAAPGQAPRQPPN